MIRQDRRIAAIAIVVVTGLVVAAAAWALTRPRSPEERLAAARELAGSITVTVAVADSSLLVGTAIADFGVGKEIRLVRVRIVDELRLSVRVSSDVDVELATDPKACLVGPYSAPDDAGLSVPCWGEPDVGEALAAQLASGGAGRLVLRAGQPATLEVDLRRGAVRCDYAPGAWHLDLSVEPIVDGTSGGLVELPSADLAIPFSSGDVLVQTRDSRYCGLAETIFKEQGEPAIASPSP